MVLFEVRQLVKSINKQWLECVYKSPPSNDESMYRLSEGIYLNAIKQNPNEYFELVKITTEEDCIFHVKNKSTVQHTDKSAT